MGDRQISTQVRELIKCIFQFIFYYTQVRVVNCSVRVPRVLCAGITRASSVFNAAVHESGTVVFEEKLSTDIKIALTIMVKVLFVRASWLIQK